MGGMTGEGGNARGVGISNSNAPQRDNAPSPEPWQKAVTPSTDAPPDEAPAQRSAPRICTTPQADMVLVHQEPVSPQSEKNWAASTKTRLGKAKSLRLAAEGELAKTTVGMTEGRQKNQDVGAKMQNYLRKKIDTTHSLARSLWDRTTGTEDTIRHMGHSIFQLTRSVQATITPLDVVNRCLELRRGRPVQELVHDQFQKALEEEQAILIYTQKQYGDRVEISKSILQELEAAKVLLHQDMVRKRHANRLDKNIKTALTRSAHLDDSQERNENQDDGELQPDIDDPSLPRLSEMIRGEVDPAGPYGQRPQSAPHGSQGTYQGAERPESPAPPLSKSAREKGGRVEAPADAQTVNWKDSAKQLLANTYDLGLTATRICVKNDEMLRDRQKECENARKMVVEHMRKRLSEVAEMRRALENEIRETDFAVAGMEEGLAETERQCEMHSVPLTAMHKTTEARKKRMEGERIRDTVTLAKEEVVQVINANVRALQDQYKRKKMVLEQMRGMREQLREDVKNKIIALSIDNQCSKLLTRPHSARPGHPSPPNNGTQKPQFRRRNPREAQIREIQQQQQREQQRQNEGYNYARMWGPSSNGGW